ncbi:MAG: VWA domain-containing protein, partial [Acidobacteriota bacterium]
RWSPYPGSDLGEAIDLARQSFPASTGAQRVLVLVTDGEDFEGHAVEAARRAAGEGIVVYTVGTGTPGGGPIPLRGQGGVSGGYKKDEEGRVVTTRLEAKRLESMARAGKGRLFMATTSLATADVLAGKIDRMTKADLSSRIITVYRDRFQIPLALAFLILLVEGFISGARRDALEPSR